MSCIGCKLRRETEVVYKGRIPADIMFIGESPGYQEVNNPKSGPFQGRAGKLLRKEANAEGLYLENCFLANSARCLLNKKELTASEIKVILKNCRHKLATAIEAVKPKIIVCLGAIALEQVLGKKGIKKYRGQFFDCPEFSCTVYSTWHPAYILRNNNELATFKGDIHRLVEYIKNGYKLKEDKIICKEVESIRPLLDGKNLYHTTQNIKPENNVRVLRAEHAEPLKLYATAIDTETQGLNWYDPNSICLSYSVSVTESEGWNIVLHEEVPAGEGDFDIEIKRGGTKKTPTLITIGVKRVSNYNQKVSELKELCERTDIKKYFMNQKFDIHRLESLGVKEIKGAVMDVALAAHVLDSERWTGASLKDLIEGFTSMQNQHKDEFSETEKSDMIRMLAEHRDRFTRYACLDSVATLRIALELRKQLSKDSKSLNYYVTFVQPIEGSLLYEIERNGVLIDTAKIPEIKAEIDSKMKELTNQFIRNCPEKVIEFHKLKGIKLTRRIILCDALFSYTSHKTGELVDLGLRIPPIEISPKTKMPLVNKDVLKRITDSTFPKEAKKLVEIYNKWSLYNTLKTRYIKNISEHVGMDNRIHPTYSSTYTSSGRTGARNPSIQNFPARSEVAGLIRKLLIAPPGKVLMDVDYKTSELRWVAHRADETSMKKVFESGGDIHLATGLELAGYRTVDTSIDKETLAQTLKISIGKIKKLRQSAKAINFGLIYNMSVRGFKEYAYLHYGLKLTLKQAEEWRNNFFSLRPRLLPWHRESENHILTHGWVRHAFGRKRNLKNAFSSESMKRAEAVRIGTNFEIQGPSSDATLMGGHSMMQDSEFNHDECKIVIFLHDSLTFEVDKNKMEKYYHMVEKHLTNINTELYGFKLTVPLAIDGKVGKNLSETTAINL